MATSSLFRAISTCALAQLGIEVTLLYPRPFRIPLDQHGVSIQHICLLDQLSEAPRWWRELWSRLASRPSNLCLAWIIWRVKKADFDHLLWTDFQDPQNLWPVACARLLGLYPFSSAYVEHHPPDPVPGFKGRLRSLLRLDRIRLAGMGLITFSAALLQTIRQHHGVADLGRYVPWGVWPDVLSEQDRVAARQALGIESAARVLLVFGVQAVQRKHLDTLAEALRADDFEQPLVVLFVGARVSNQNHPFDCWSCAQHKLKLLFDNEFVPESQVRNYFAAADGVWACYRDFSGASGVLLQAMGYGRMVLSSTDGEIGALTRQSAAGILVDASSALQMRQSIMEFVGLTVQQQRDFEAASRQQAERQAWPRAAAEIVSWLESRRVAA